MGIDSFNPLLRELQIPAMGTLPLTSLHGRRLAIDGHNWMYSRLASVKGTMVKKLSVEELQVGVDRGQLLKEWIDACLQFCVTLMAYGITPLWIFDGEHPPDKINTKKKRVDKKQAAVTELNQLREQVEQLPNQLQIDAQTIQRMKTLMGQDTRIYRDEQEVLRSTLEGIGLPCFRAVGEAEQLCAMMCLDGIAAAVFSNDTDNLCYGAPLMVTGFANPVYDPNTGSKVHHFDYCYLPAVLQGLQMDMVTFREMCILLGCDYNNKIPGVGKKTAHKLITQHRTIDRIAEATTYDVRCLRAPRCRWLFMYRPYQDVLTRPDHEAALTVDRFGPRPPSGDQRDRSAEDLFQMRNVIANQARDVLEPLGLSKWLVRLSQIVPGLQPPQNIPLESIDPMVLQVKQIQVPEPPPDEPEPQPLIMNAGHTPTAPVRKLVLRPVVGKQLTMNQVPCLPQQTVSSSTPQAQPRLLKLRIITQQ